MGGVSIHLKIIFSNFLVDGWSGSDRNSQNQTSQRRGDLDYYEDYEWQWINEEWQWKPKVNIIYSQWNPILRLFSGQSKI